MIILKLLGWANIPNFQTRPHYSMRVDGMGPLTHIETLSLKFSRRIYQLISQQNHNIHEFEKLDPYYFQAYFEKSLAIESIVSATSILATVRWKIQKDGPVGVNYFSHSVTLPMSQDMISEAFGRNLTILRYGRVSSLLSLIGSLLVAGMFLLVRLKNYLLFASSRKNLMKRIDPSVKKFATEYHWGVSTNGLSEMFWLRWSRTARNGFLYIFSRPQTQTNIDDNLLNHLDSLGVHWIFLYKHKKYGSKYHYRLYINFHDILSLARHLMMKNNTADIFLHMKLFQLKFVFLIKTYSWKNFLTDTNSLAVTLINECVPDNLPVLAGASLANCISVGKQKSIHQNPVPETSHMCHDLYFLWNHLNDNVYKNNPYVRIKTRVYTGALYEYLSDFAKNTLAESKKNMTSGLYTIGFFDHYFKDIYDAGDYWGNCWISREMVIDFYKRLVSIIQNHPETALVLKPLKGLQNLPEVLPLLDSLIQQKRCIVLSGISPSAAASICNLIISGWDLPTAGTEALLFTHDQRSVMFDFVGYRHSLFANEDVSNFIFEDIPSVCNGLEHHLNNTHDSRFGDWGKLIDKVLLYQDHQGYNRAGRYLDWLFETEGSPCHRIRSANRKFLAEFKHLEVSDKSLL